MMPGHPSIRFRKWGDHNRRALKDVDAKRKARGVPLNSPLSLAKVIVVTHLDGQFAAFANIVGGAVAETYFVRAMQYAADHSGHVGAIEVPREFFGPIVLSRSWHLVSRLVGEKVYDALLASTICVLSADQSVDVSADQSADLSHGMAHPPAPAPSPSPEVAPLPPASGGRTDASLPPQNGHDPGTANGHSAGRRASESDRAVVDAILTKQAAFFGPASAQPASSVKACEVRRRLRAGTMPDEEIFEFLRGYELAFADTAEEIRRGVQRKARAARRDEAPTFERQDAE